VLRLYVVQCNVTQSCFFFAIVLLLGRYAVQRNVTRPFLVGFAIVLLLVFVVVQAMRHFVLLLILSCFWSRT
jgi:hypothetical protein